MKELILSKGNLKAFLEGLPHEVFVPKLVDDVISFEEFDGEGIELSRNSTKPPKGIIFPQTEPLFGFEKRGKDVKLETDQVEEKTKAVFGIRPCDAKSFLILDPVFKRDYEDTCYLEKRDKTLLIGVACNEPGINCFCTSFGLSPSSKDGLDILFTDLGDRYYVEVVSKKGEEASTSDLFITPTREEKEKKEELHKNVADKIKRKMDKDAIKKLEEEDLFNDGIWKEISRKCIGCGTCTYLCPTCHCFDIQDEVAMLHGRRVRVWDSCMFPEYTLEASGHNPRPTRAERLRNRIYHKYKWYPENFGEIACVGCGRCIEKCPVNIDVIEIMERIKIIG
jgi:ferredoxin